MSLQGAYISDVEKLTLQNKPSITSIVTTSGYEIPDYIEGEFYVHKHNKLGFMHVEDSRGMWFVPAHCLADQINELVDSGLMLFIEETPDKKSKKEELKEELSENKFNVGDRVVKVIETNSFGINFKTGSFYWVVSESSHPEYVCVSDEEDGEPYGDVDQHSYHQETGDAYENILPGSSSYLLTEKEAIDLDIEME